MVGDHSPLAEYVELPLPRVLGRGVRGDALDGRLAALARLLRGRGRRRLTKLGGAHLSRVLELGEPRLLGTLPLDLRLGRLIARGLRRLPLARVPRHL